MRHTQPTSSEDETDRALLQRVAEQDRRAFEALYQRYARRLGGYLWRMVGRSDLAEEALSDVMLTVWQSAGRYDGRARVSTWLFGIAHNKALNALRSARRRGRETLSDEPFGEQVPDETAAASPETALLERDRMRSLKRALEGLSEDHRAVVELTFVEGRSYAEIAEVLGCPVNTVKTRMYYARKHLGRALGKDAPRREDTRGD